MILITGTRSKGFFTEPTTLSHFSDLKIQDIKIIISTNYNVASLTGFEPFGFEFLIFGNGFSFQLWKDQFFYILRLHAIAGLDLG